MPTSSQALILIKSDSGRLSTLYKTRITPDIAPFPLSKVNLTGEATTARRGRTMPVGPDVMVDSHREGFQASKPLEGLTVNGYRGVLSFDPMLKSFRWQLLPDPTDTQSDRLKVSQRSASAPEIEEHHRVQEEVVLTNLDDLPDRTSSADNTYRRLLDLGFRTPSFRGIDSPPTPEPWESRTSESDVRRQHPARPTTARVRSPQHGLTAERNMSAPTMGLVIPHPPTPRDVIGIPNNRTTWKIVIPSVASRYKSSWKPASSSSEPPAFSENPFSGGRPLPPILEKTRPYSRSRSRSRSRRFRLSRSENQLSRNISGEEKVLLDEEKKTSKRKKAKLPSIRMRRHLPPSSPNALCFCLRHKRPYSHEEIKVLLEEQLNTRIGALLYDPVYMHLGPDKSDGACLWAFTLENEALRMLLLHKGITFEGERVRVRRYDDVMYDEHQAFKLYNDVDEEQRRRKLTTTSRRESLKPISGGVALGPMGS